MKHALHATLLASAFAFSPLGHGQTGTIQPQTDHPNRPPATSEQGGTSDAQSGTRSSSPSSQSGQTAQSDQEFVKTAASSGLAEVESGKLAKKRASSDEVREMADKMVEDHSRANDRLTAIASRQNITLPKEPDAAERSEIERLQKLSGQAFDRALLAHERKAHREAIALYSRQAESGSNPELKRFASEQLPKLREHLEKVESLQRNMGGGEEKKEGRK